MKNISMGILTLAISCLLFTSLSVKAENLKISLKEEVVTYAADGVTMKGFVVYDNNKKGTRPAILVVPEWWGLNDYAKMRARELAKLGYIAMAVDIFGDGKTADNPKDAGALAGPFYQNPQSAKTRIEAAIEKIKTFSQTDANNIGAVGYCFGGGTLLNIVRLGTNLKGIVSFHGSLIGTPLKKELVTSKILVCHGGADPFVPKAQADQFKHEMDSANVAYTFKEYAGATHAFTNPNSTAVGLKFNIPIAYNEAADKASWVEMKKFFKALFKK